MSLDGWDLDPDRALVGIALHRADVVDDVAVQGGDFKDPKCEAVWDTIRRLRTAGEPVDPVTVYAALPKDVRGVTAEWIADAFGSAPPAAGAEHYAKLVLDAATLRRLASAATRIQQAVREGMPAAEAVQAARGWVDACQSTGHGNTGYLADHLDEWLTSLEQAPELTPTAWPDLNQIIGGWRPGALYVIGARPGVGKTLFSTQAAVDLAGAGHVAVSNMEMSHGEVMHRIAAQTSGVWLGRLLDRKLTAQDWDAITRHTPVWAAMPLSIDDTPAATLAHVRAHARSVARKGHLAGVVVDYIQLMTAAPGPYRSRVEVVAEFSRGLKLLAQELHAPVIALAQLNRQSADVPPRMQDLKESGSLEQDADVVMLLHLEADGTTLGINVPKNRHGPTGDLQVVRRGHVARIESMGWEPSRR